MSVQCLTKKGSLSISHSFTRKRLSVVVRNSYCDFILLLKSMQTNLEVQDVDILQTIDLTTKLQQSLRRLLTKKKSFDPDQFATVSPRSQREDNPFIAKIQALEQQNKELYADNQRLSKEILSLKEDLREFKKQIQGTKKYIEFLQSYNDDLKKELLFWMKGKKETTVKEEPSMSELMSKIARLRKENEENEAKLTALGKSVQGSKGKASSETLHKQPFNFDLSKFQNKSISKSHSKRTSQDCAGCKYKSKSKSKPKKPQVSNFHLKCNQSNASFQKGKNLRNWHNHYVSSNDYNY